MKAIKWLLALQLVYIASFFLMLFFGMSGGAGFYDTAMFGAFFVTGISLLAIITTVLLFRQPGLVSQKVISWLIVCCSLVVTGIVLQNLTVATPNVSEVLPVSQYPSGPVTDDFRYPNPFANFVLPVMLVNGLLVLILLASLPATGRATENTKKLS